MSAQKTERLLNLVICLLSTRQFLAKEQIRAAIPQYADCATDEAFDRMFERDKDEVREMGIPLETGSNSRLVRRRGRLSRRPGRLRPARGRLRTGRARRARASRPASGSRRRLAGPASRALLKLKAAGVDPDDAAVGRCRAAGGHQRAGLRRPLRRRSRPAAGHASPTAPAAPGDVVDRHLEPWGIVSWHGRWYVVGHDRDRGATRVFRLSRVAGPVLAVGRPGEVVVPAGRRHRADRSPCSPGTSPTARPRCTYVLGPASVCGAGRHGRAPERPPATGTRSSSTSATPSRWPAEIAGYGPDVVAAAPETVKDAVVRRLHRRPRGRLMNPAAVAGQ